MKTNKLLLLKIGILFGLPAFAQPGGTAPDQNMFPGMTNYGISNVYATNLFDGSVNVSIPIYGHSTEDGDFGVSFTYNTRGVQVSEVANPEGLHWILQAEGCSIERVIKDIPDEINILNGPDSVYMGPFAYYNKNRFIKGKLGTYWESPAEQARDYVYRDGECDEFVVALAGQKFTFYLGKDLSVFTHPKRNVKIVPLLNGVPLFSVTNQEIGTDYDNNQLEFLITDERGNKFLFERGNFNYMNLYDNSLWDNNIITSVIATTRWNLKNVTFADGSKIEYTYAHSWDNGANQVGHTTALNQYVKEEGTNFTFLGNRNRAEGGWFSQLTNIRYPNGAKLGFVYDSGNLTEAGRKTLLEITLQEGDHASQCIRYKLQQTLYNGRRQLVGIKIASCDNSVEEPYYSFEYLPNLPARLSPAVDFFGYFNNDFSPTPIGFSDNNLTIPKHHYSTPGVTNYGRSRVYAADYASAGLLNVVKNAYGGKLQLHYGANTVNVINNVPVPGGSANNFWIGDTDAGLDGVRVESITQTDKFNPGQELKIVYDYHNSGQVLTYGGYVHYPSYIDDATNTVTQNIFQSQFLTAHQLVNGSNHGYSQVGVLKYNQANELLSRTEYSFTNMSDNFSGNQPRFFKAPGSKDMWEYPYTNKQYLKDWEIGLPLEVTEYDNNNRIVLQTTNVYSFGSVELSAQGNFASTKTSKVNTGTAFNPNLVGIEPYYLNKKIFTDAYYPYTGRAELSKIISKKYVSDNRWVADTVDYQYDSHNNLQLVTTRDSKGKQLATKFIYNYNVDGPNSQWGTVYPGTTLYNMTGAGLEHLVAVEQWMPNPVSAPFNDRLISSTVNKYHYSPGKLLKSGSVTFSGNEPLSYTQHTGISMGSPMTNPYGRILAAYNTSTAVPHHQRSEEVTLFDGNGNPLETKYISQNKYVTAFFDTANNTMLAQVSNGRHNEAAFTSFEEFYDASSPMTKGNLEVNSTRIIDVFAAPTLDAISGTHIYELSTGFTISDISGTQDLTPGKEYLLSFWAKGGQPDIYLGATLLPQQSAPSYQIGDWKNYIYRFSVTSAARIKISPKQGLTIYLDELRLHPAKAIMNSWTYAPFGISTMTDNTGRVTYYEYDKLGRVNLVKNQEKNIIRKMTRKVAGGL